MTERTFETIAQEVRDSAPLLQRLEECRERIGRMCSERRPPRMTIPVQWSDDDEFISVTIKDAIDALMRYRRDAFIANALDRPTVSEPRLNATDATSASTTLREPQIK